MFAGSVMIDIDGELFAEIDDTRPVDAGTFDHKHSIVFLVDLFDLADQVCSRKRSIGYGDVVGNDHFSGFTQRVQKPTKSERRTDAVTIGANVRGDRKSLLVF